MAIRMSVDRYHREEGEKPHGRELHHFVLRLTRTDHALIEGSQPEEHGPWCARLSPASMYCNLASLVSRCGASVLLGRGTTASSSQEEPSVLLVPHSRCKARLPQLKHHTLSAANCALIVPKVT